MKFVALACLVFVSACDRSSPAAESVENNAQAYEAALRNEAANLSSMADGAADRNAADAMRNAADELDAARRNVGDAADAQVQNLR
ncbi:hypothetical protein [Sphingomonas sp.]|uniref:hypothetical protein n=1 Tax=Sphingomonas sp. TaxID=28214 RepID=UPI003B004CDC